MNRRSFLRLTLSAIAGALVGKNIIESEAHTGVVAEDYALPVSDNREALAQTRPVQSMLSQKHYIIDDFDGDEVTSPFIDDMPDLLTYSAAT